MALLIDTHSHLNFDDYKVDREAVIERALAQNTWLINVGSDYKTSERAASLAQIYTSGVYAAVGIHPIYVANEKFRLDDYERLARQPKVVAIGEMGLDYFHLNDYEPVEAKRLKKLQHEVFEKHLDLVRLVNKPVIFHCRDAHQDLIKILKDSLFQESGVVHCFSATLKDAEDYLELGLYIGLNGLITFSDDYNDVIKKIPLEKIILETDCPYLTPVPLRGKRNEPAFVKYVAEKVALIKDVSFSEVAEVTTHNAKTLFKL